MGLRVPVALLETAAVGSPALFGFLRPRLLLPVGLMRSFSPEELRYVFLHELSHIKRRDILTGWLMTALQILHWFNPLVWLAFYRMRVDRELACDALALSYAKEEENQGYGRTIIKLLEGFGCSAWGPSLAGTVENRRQMKERIRMIAQFHGSNRGFAVAALLFIGLGLVTLTDAQVGPGGKATETVRADIRSVEKQKLEMAQAGDKWAAYWLWDSYYRGKNRIKADPGKADKWLREFVQNLWVVRFEPLGDFPPASPEEFLEGLHHYAHAGSGKTAIGMSAFFRTTQQGGKLVGSYLSNYPDQLKASLAKVPGLKVTSVEKITAEEFIKYEQSPLESLDEASSESKKLPKGFKQKMGQDQEKYTPERLGDRYRHTHWAAVRKDQEKYTPEQLRDAEELYRVAYQKRGSPERTASLRKLVEKYPDINRTGCATLYLAQASQGEERARYLQDCIEKYNDCCYGDGVQVGAYARFLLAGDYWSRGQEKKAAALYSEIKAKYADAVDHRGNLLVESIIGL